MYLAPPFLQSSNHNTTVVATTNIITLVLAQRNPSCDPPIARPALYKAIARVGSTSRFARSIERRGFYRNVAEG